MPKYKPWLENGRQVQLDMALLWMTVLPEETEDEKGVKVKKWTLWGIPQEVFFDFAGKAGTAQAALSDAKNEEKHTPVIDKKVETAFKAMVDAMRSIKKLYFHIPPLTEADFASLGLTVPDRSYTFTGAPTAQIVADLYLTKGRHELGVRARYLKGSPDERANKTYEYWYVLKAPGEKAPENPAEFTKLFDTKRKVDTIPFEFGDSGKMVYVISRVANGKKKGPWGPIVSAIIP